MEKLVNPCDKEMEKKKKQPQQRKHMEKKWAYKDGNPASDNH
jgi:hypothetical protein